MNPHTDHGVFTKRLSGVSSVNIAALIVGNVLRSAVVLGKAQQQMDDSIHTILGKNASNLF